MVGGGLPDMVDDVRPAASQGPEDLPIDLDLIKVLASDSRREILRLLQERRMTLSELAARLGLKKATVLEHLKKLTEANLIRRLEDDRLWVYYELTHRGGRLVNPGRTRFFLVLGWAAAAALLLAGAAALAIAFQGADDAAPDATRAAAMGGLHAEVEPVGKLAGGAPVALRASVRADTGAAQPAEALLLTAADARLAASGQIQGIPLVPASTSPGGEVELRSAAPLPAGDYYLYVRDAAGRDNADNLTSVRVPAYRAEGPALLWRGITDGASFAVRRDAEPVNGTLLLVNATVATLKVQDGLARLPPEEVDALPAGSYGMQLLLADLDAPLTLPQRVEVRDPLAVVAPRDLAQREQATLTITLALGDDAPREAPVLVDGQPAPATRVAPGVLRVAIDAAEPGAREVKIGRLVTREVEVHPDVALSLAPTGDGRLNLSARSLGAQPASNLTVLLDGAAVGATDGNGTLAFEPPASGVYSLRLAGADGPAAPPRVVRFEGWNVTEVRDEVALTLLPPRVRPDAIEVEARIEPPHPIERRVTLYATLDGTVVHAARVGLENATASRAFEIPHPPPGDHRLSVRVEPLPLSPLRFLNGTAADAAGADEASAAPSPASPSPAPTSTPPLSYYQDAARDDGAASYRVLALSTSATDVQVRVDAPWGAEDLQVPVPTKVAAGADARAQHAPAVPAPPLALVALAVALAAVVWRRRGR